MKSKELADELDAEDRLKARGYYKKDCNHCKGTGFLPGFESNSSYHVAPYPCFACDGKGWRWEAPITQ
jgi:hypothetical protein